MNPIYSSTEVPLTFPFFLEGKFFSLASAFFGLYFNLLKFVQKL